MIPTSPSFYPPPAHFLITAPLEEIMSSLFHLVSVFPSNRSSICGDRRTLRFGDRGWNGKKRRRGLLGERGQTSLPPLAASTNILSSSSQKRKSLSDSDIDEVQVLKIAREKFTHEISFSSKDKDISLAKALLFVAAEDEAFMAFNRDLDACSLQNERKDAPLRFEACSEWDCLEEIPLAGKNISGWLIELDLIAKEVEAELVSRDIGCHLVQVLEAVNVVLFESRGFKRFSATANSKFSYLHTVLNSGCGSAFMISIIYIEVCRRLGITIVGSRVGEDFLIWPRTENLEELFKVSLGHSLFATVNGRCVEDPRAKASDLNSESLLGLEMATNRDIIGIALANLIRLYWKRASRTNHGLMLTSPLRPVHYANEKSGQMDRYTAYLLRPQDVRLAIMACERLLILQPHNWALRRDHGMLLYYNRRYAEAVQELSICMAFAPVEEAEILEAFVEKLHLLRLESSWKSLEESNQLAIP